MSHTGLVITASADVFSQPRREGASVSTLTEGCFVAVQERQTEWFRVTLDAAGSGFVDASCVAIVDPEGRGFLAADVGLQRADVEAPEGERLASGGGATEAAVARAWNLYGGLLSELATRAGIEPSQAVAVLCVESGGRGFGPDGRAIIRFENHIFRRRLGDARAAEFDRHFRIGGPQSWLGHEFRSAPSEPWAAFHGSQALEWRAYEVACALDPDAAARSISVGLPQIMGFNHPLVGYPTPQAMLAFMSADVRFQVLGLFDFIGGAGGNGAAVQALRQGDYDRFATLYNGPGQARFYGDLIEAHVHAFRRLRPATKSAAALSGKSSTASAASTNASGGRRYEVRPGDTLGAIAGRFGVPLRAVVEANDIADPNRIFPGQVLMIPGSEPAPPPVIVPSAPPEDIVEETTREGHPYVVRPGDTLGRIAQRAGTLVSDLARANGIENVNLIFPGQVIFTPVEIT